MLISSLLLVSLQDEKKQRAFQTCTLFIYQYSTPSAVGRLHLLGGRCLQLACMLEMYNVHFISVISIQERLRHCGPACGLDPLYDGPKLNVMDF